MLLETTVNKLPLAENAACRGSNLDFYVDVSTSASHREKQRLAENPRPEVKAALAVCKTCPVRIACLEWALDHEKWGIWGGTLPHQRDTLRRRRVRAHKMQVEDAEIAGFGG